MEYLVVFICALAISVYCAFVFNNLRRINCSHYHHRAFCDCGWSAQISVKTNFFAPDPCPKCGASKESFELKTVRWKSDAKIWNPWTWSNGEWEEVE